MPLEGPVGFFPWMVCQGTWEVSHDPTAGKLGADFQRDMEMKVSIVSPDICVVGAVGELANLNGHYMQQGELNGRACYTHKLQEFTIDGGGPLSLWFAEERGQWVFSTPESLGNSKTVLARVASRSWWPWEAHLGGSTSPVMGGALPPSELGVGTSVTEVLQQVRT